MAISAVEIDTSQIKQEPSGQQQTWRAPRHVFFGKKGADGVMEDEPVYSHQKYPCMLYKPVDDKLSAILVHSDDEFTSRLADGYADSPAKFGIVTAPSFEQINAPAEVAAEVDQPRRGRPPKDKDTL